MVQVMLTILISMLAVIVLSRDISNSADSLEELEKTANLYCLSFLVIAFSCFLLSLTLDSSVLCFAAYMNIMNGFILAHLLSFTEHHE